jgi:hypothetical protein
MGAATSVSIAPENRPRTTSFNCHRPTPLCHTQIPGHLTSTGRVPGTGEPSRRKSYTNNASSNVLYTLAPNAVLESSQVALVPEAQRTLPPRGGTLPTALLRPLGLAMLPSIRTTTTR